MARPPPNILLAHDQPDGELWEVTECETNYVILYKEKLCAVRVHSPMSAEFNLRVKYKRLSYPTEGSAKRQVRLLNKKFNCLDFSYARLG